MRSLITSIIVGLVMWSQNAGAGLLLEPGVGYQLGSFSAKSLGGTPESVSINGIGYGLRLGIKSAKGFCIAGDYQSGQLKEKSTTAETDWLESVLGATLGYDSGGGFRVFGGYGFTFSATEKFSSGDNVYTGTQIKLGFGYRLKILTLNLEYRMNNVTKVKASSGVEVPISAIFSEVSYSAVVLGLSFPFDLGGK